MFTLGNGVPVAVKFRHDADVVAGNWINIDWKQPIDSIRQTLSLGSQGPANERVIETSEQAGIIFNFPDRSPWEGYYRLKDSSNQAVCLASDMHAVYMQMMKLFGMR